MLRVALLLLVGCATTRPVRSSTDLSLPPPLDPSDNATIETTRPRFTWQLAPGTDGAVLDICYDRECTAVLESIEGTTDATPTHDLPSIPLFYRLRAKTGEKRSESRTVPRRFELHVVSTLHGKHIDLTLPYDAQPLGKRLVALSDDAFEKYASWLGAPVPSGRCTIELLLPAVSARRRPVDSLSARHIGPYDAGQVGSREQLRRAQARQPTRG